MNRVFRKGLSWLLVVAMVMTMFAGTTFTASAKTEGTISAETVTAYVLAKDGVTKQQIASWTADSENDTYKDADNNEIPAAVTVSNYDNYGDGTNQNYILYTGSDMGFFGRTVVVTKYIDVKEFAAVLAEQAGLVYNPETYNVVMKSDVDNWTTAFGKTGNYVVDSTQKLYTSFEWINAVRENSTGYGGSKNISVNDYTDKKEVPAVLAICSWNCRLNGLKTDSGVDFSDKETLKSAITALAEKTDMANALRFVSGMDTAVTDGKYMNTGANSAKGISSITLQPTYNAINVTDGTQVADTEAGRDLAYRTGNATVKTGDNYFTAAEGETVTLNIAADDGYRISGVAVTDAENNSVDVTKESTGIYKFKMPAGEVNVKAAAVKRGIVLDESVKDSISFTKDNNQIKVTASPEAGYYAVIKYVTDEGTSYIPYKGSNEYEFTAPAEDGIISADFVKTVWDGTLDFSWYNEADKKDSYTIYTPAQWSALAWICSEELDQIADGKIGEGTATNGNVTAITGNIPIQQNYMNGVQFYLNNDIDMGGVNNEGTWSGPNYYPVGCEGADDKGNSASFFSVFFGSFDGQGHWVNNIYCHRGDTMNDQCSGLFGRVGQPDNDHSQGPWWGKPYEGESIVIKNVGVTGDIYGGRSIGGIVGKTLHVASGNTVVIENCINKASVGATNKKGAGGVVGSSWNGAIIKNCANMGDIDYSGTYYGGIAGNSEATVINCYNVGYCNGKNSAAIGANNSGMVIKNCYALEGSASTGKLYDGGKIDSASKFMTADEMKSDAFIETINGTDRAWVKDTGINDGYPIPRTFTNDTSVCTGVEIVSAPEKLHYVAGQKFDTTGLKIVASWSDGTTQLVEDYTVSKTDELTVADNDTKITVSGNFKGYDYKAEYTITVEDNTVQKIVASGYTCRILYVEGESFDPKNLIVTVYYSNGKSERKTILNSDGSLLEGFAVAGTALTEENKTVTVSYTEDGKTVTDSFDVQVEKLDNMPKQDENGTYIINTASELSTFSVLVNKAGKTDADAVLKKDITADSEFSPIGGRLSSINIKSENGGNLSYSANNYYGGTFDGNGKTITLAIEGTGYLGLFGYTKDAVIKGVTVVGSVSGTGQYIAGLVAYADSGTTKIVSCTNNAAVSGTSNIGGIISSCGYSAVVEITDCHNTGDINGTGSVGGIAGNINSNVIRNCSNSGTITSTGSYTGGIAGKADVSDSTNDGTVNGAAYTGGIAGLYNKSNGTLSGCINRGDVSGTNNVGGVAGNSFAAKASDCYNYGDITAKAGTAKQGIGGIIGSNGNYALEMENCYNMGKITRSNDTINIGALVGYGSKLITINDSYYISGCLAGAEDAVLENAGLGNVKDATNDTDNSKALSEQEIQGEILKDLTEKILDLNKELADAKNASAEEIAKLESELNTLKEAYEQQLKTIEGQQGNISDLEKELADLKKQLDDLQKELENLKKSQGSGGTVISGGGAAADNELASEKEKAMKELQALLDKSDEYYADEKAELASAVLAGIRQIESARDKAAAQKALTEAKAKISTIKTKAQVDAEKAELEKTKLENAKKEISQLKVKVTSSKTSKGNIKVKAKVNAKAITDLGYTVKYKYYRSVKKASGYKAMKTKSSKTYINTTGKKGTKYYYKVKALVYDGDKLIGSTKLKQSTAASRKK